ncbi:MAG: 50S ribosomal protein L24 [Bdellovibrionaceae bacterium]|jgi:large subunit ribosomal protein L24|nr:50S ribosomal protein L24 [Pseudobdellovibrionaceae bacterium]
MKLKIKKGDTVEVVAGGDKGKKGLVLELNSSKLKVRIQGAKMQTCYDKEEGMVKREGLMDYSNVKLVSAAKAVKRTKSKAKSK